MMCTSGARSLSCDVVNDRVSPGSIRSINTDECQLPLIHIQLLIACLTDGEMLLITTLNLTSPHARLSPHCRQIRNINGPSCCRVTKRPRVNSELADRRSRSAGISRPRADSAPPTPVNRMSMSPPPSITNTTPPHNRKQRHTVVAKTASKSSTVSLIVSSQIPNPLFTWTRNRVEIV